MKIGLKREKRRGRWNNDRFVHKDWKEAEPFFVNPRGILVHRVRYVNAICIDGEDSHNHVTYWCGNGCCFEIEDVKEVFCVSPPEGMLLCQFCEVRATNEEQPKADSLAGRHVHIGVLKAHQVCCRTQDNN